MRAYVALIVCVMPTLSMLVGCGGTPKMNDSSQRYAPSYMDWVITKLRASGRVPWMSSGFPYALTFNKGERDDEVMICIDYNYPTNEVERWDMLLSINKNIDTAIQLFGSEKDSGYRGASLSLTILITGNGFSELDEFANSINEVADEVYDGKKGGTGSRSGILDKQREEFYKRN